MINTNKKGKVSIIGAGYVGSTISYALMLSDIVKEIVLINRNEEKSKSEIDDIRHGFKFVGDTILRVGNFEDIKESDVIVITIGRNRKSGETRLDLASDNINIVNSVLPEIKKNYGDSILIVVTNPIDIITQKVCNYMNLPYGKIFGTGCILDSSRLIRLIADYVKCNIEDVRAMAIGEHGEGVVILWSNVLVKNILIDEYCRIHNIKWDDNIKNEIENKVRGMGASIIKNKGRTQYGIATCVADLINAIVYDKKILVSVSSPMQNEYGIMNVCMSYPSIIGRNGIEERVKINIKKEEKELLINSFIKLADFVRIM